MKIRNQRLVPNAIEPRSYIGDYSTARDQYTLSLLPEPCDSIADVCVRVGSQSIRSVLLLVMLGAVLVAVTTAEEALVTWASRQIGRPVKWTADEARHL